MASLDPLLLHHQTLSNTLPAPLTPLSAGHHSGRLRTLPSPHTLQPQSRQTPHHKDPRESFRNQQRPRQCHHPGSSEQPHAACQLPVHRRRTPAGPGPRAAGPRAAVGGRRLVRACQRQPRGTRPPAPPAPARAAGEGGSRRLGGAPPRHPVLPNAPAVHHSRLGEPQGQARSLKPEFL